MDFPDIFTSPVAEKVIDRIENLEPTTKPGWGKMNVSQMLAHVNVAYEMVYDNKHPGPNFLMRVLLRPFIKKIVVGPAPYKRNSQTAPQFVIQGQRDFELEKKRLADYIRKTQELGATHFDGKESLSLGKLNINEWNTMFYKHVDHHLQQFVV